MNQVLYQVYVYNIFNVNKLRTHLLIKRPIDELLQIKI